MKSPIELAKKLDEKTIEIFQKSYFWLLDRTGLYVASMALVIHAAGLAIFDWSQTTFWWLAILISLGAMNFAILGMRYWMQGSGQIKWFNCAAENMRSWAPRHSLNIMLIIFSVINGIAMDWRGVVLNIIFLAYNYTFLITIRDREKKPFWERNEETAMEGA